GLVEVILYQGSEEELKPWLPFPGREYEDRKAAVEARSYLMSGKVKVWENPVTVEWVDLIKGLEIIAK
ncbi:hypothetical protein Z043_125814, partial [Scleropages formosus]